MTNIEAINTLRTMCGDISSPHYLEAIGMAMDALEFHDNLLCFAQRFQDGLIDFSAQMKDDYDMIVGEK